MKKLTIPAFAIAFANLAIDVVDTTTKLIALATRLTELLNRNPQLKRGLRQWSSPLQMLTAFTASAAEKMSLKPELSPREMEAVVLIVGYRPLRDEFGETRLREDAWRKLLKTVRKNLLPQVRSLHVP